MGFPISCGRGTVVVQFLGNDAVGLGFLCLGEAPVKNTKIFVLRKFLGT